MTRLPSPTRIGIDLDNTLVCYDNVFHHLALQRGLIAADCPANKVAVRQQLCDQGRESMWTELQGEAYGSHMYRATPFPGALEFVKQCHERDLAVFIVSHRTALPIAGAAYDLHDAARRWLINAGFSDTIDGVWLETSRAAKLRQIAALDLDCFVDDLVDVLLAPDFPAATTAIHFASHAPGRCHERLHCAGSWNDVQRVLWESP